RAGPRAGPGFTPDRNPHPARIRRRGRGDRNHPWGLLRSRDRMTTFYRKNQDRPPKEWLMHFRLRGPADGGFLSSRGAGILAVLAALVVGVPTVFGVISGFERTSGGEVAVVRNGGPFDDNKIRQIIPPGSSITWTG